MSAPKAESGDLNYDMNYNIFQLKNCMQNLKSTQERQFVNRWLHKLLASNKTSSEMRLRNEFMTHLVAAAKDGELCAPFDQMPPSAPLKDLRYLLKGSGARKKDAAAAAWLDTEPTEDADKPLLYKQSPDSGAFLSRQPKPRCGAFCYVTVVSKPSATDDDSNKPK